MSQVSVGDAPRLAAVCAPSGAPAPSDPGLVAGIRLPFSGPALPSRSSRSLLLVARGVRVPAAGVCSCRARLGAVQAPSP